MGLFEKIISLIINFTLIFEPLAIRIPLTPAQAQQDQNSTNPKLQVEVEILPVSYDVTDNFGAVGNFYCYPLEANVFSPSLYVDNHTATVIEKVKERITQVNKGCETIWPQILLRFIFNTSSATLKRIVTNNTSTINLLVNLNFRGDTTTDLNLTYKFYPKESAIFNSHENIILWWKNGSSSPEVVGDENKSYFDAYVTLRSQYYFRDDPDVDNLVEYIYPTTSLLKEHEEKKKRFILKYVNINFDGYDILITNVRFFKDIVSYYNYKELKEKPTLEFESSIFEKGIIGFFPTFIESLPLNSPDFVENNFCSYYQKKGGNLYLVPFQHLAVWDILVNSVGFCDEPPIFNSGIAKSEDNLCFKYTNKIQKCEIVRGDGATSTSICFVGLPFVNRFYNAFTGDVPYWDLNKKRDYRIIRTINNKLDKDFPSMNSLINKPNTPQDVDNWLNNNKNKIDYFLNERPIFTYSTLQYISSGKFVYTLNVAKNCEYVGDKVIARVDIGEGENRRTVELLPYECYTIGGKAIFAFPPEGYSVSQTESCSLTDNNWGFLYGNCNNNFFILFNTTDEYSSFLSFISKVKNVDVTNTSTPPQGIIFVIETPTDNIKKYEYKLVDFLPRIYTFNTTTYVHQFLSPQIVKHGQLLEYKFSPLWYGNPYFGSFESFTSICTLPQTGFDVSLYVNPPTGEAEIKTTECSYYYDPLQGRQQRCENVAYHLPKKEECYPLSMSVATATIDAKYDLIFFTEKYDGASLNEKIDIFLKANSALTEYRKGENVSKLRFDIFKISPTTSLNIGAISYKRKYIPAPILADFAEEIASNVGVYYERDIGGDIPNYLQSQVQYFKDSVVRELSSYLPMVLDKEEAKFSDVLSSTKNSDISDSLYLNFYPVAAQIGGKEYTIPWLVYFGMFLSSVAAFLNNVVGILNIAALLIPGLGQVILVVRAAVTVFYVASLVVETLAYLSYPDWAKKMYGDFGNFALSALIHLGVSSLNTSLILDKIYIPPLVQDAFQVFYTGYALYTSITKGDYTLTIDSNFYEVARYLGLSALLKRMTELREEVKRIDSLLDKYKLAPEGHIILYNKHPIAKGLLSTIRKDLVEDFYKADIIRKEIENARIGEITKMLSSNGVFVAAGGVLRAWAAYNAFKQMMSLGRTMLDRDKRTIREFWLKAVNLSYGYKVRNLKINLNANEPSQKLMPVFTLYGVPVYDPLYPEYGFYEPVKRFLGEVVEVSPSCARLSCSLSTSTGELILDYNVSKYEDILGGKIKEFSENKECKWFWYTDQSVSATTTRNISSEYIILPHSTSSSIITASLIGEKYLARLNLSSTDDFVNFVEYERKNLNGGRDDFVYSYIKTRENTSTLTINSWVQFPPLSSQPPQNYTCGNYSYNNLSSLVIVTSTRGYSLECDKDKTPKFKGIDTYNTCLGWRCEYDPDQQPSLHVTTPNR